jgi:uncharacterized protein YoxC
MARKIHNEVAVGITVLVVLVLGVYIVVTLADWSSLSIAQQKITVRLPYKVGLKGLSDGSPIHLGGIKVGQITHTHIRKLDPTTPGTDDVYVFFTMRIPQQYQLRRDCLLMPQSNVLGGQVLLSIEDLGRDGEIIKDGQTAELLLADSVMEAIKHEFNPDDPNSILAQVKYEVDRDNADSIVASLKSTAAQLEKDIHAIAGQIQQTLAKADSALDTAQSALKDLKEFTDDERIDKIVSNIHEISTNVKLTSQDVRRAPWKLFHKPKQKEFKIQALVDSAGAFAAGAESLDSTALRLQKLLAATDDKRLIDKDQIKSMVSELEASFEQFQKAEQKFWEELK